VGLNSPTKLWRLTEGITKNPDLICYLQETYVTIKDTQTEGEKMENELTRRQNLNVNMNNYTYT
jgi:hypothetical protein